MAGTKLTVEQFDAHSVTIHVNAEGKFWGELNGDEYSATTLELLRKKLTAAVRVKSLRVSVPATRLNRRYGSGPAQDAEPVALVGIHARTRNALVKGADGKTEQDSGYSSSFLRKLDDTELKRLKELRDRYEDARNAYDEWIATRTIQPKAEILKALKKAGMTDDQMLALKD